MLGIFGDKQQALTVGDLISFTYNDKPRLGVVEALKEQLVTIENKPDGNYKSFRFDRMQSDVTIVRTHDDKSGFVAGLKELQK